MTQLQRYNAADLPALMEKITKNSINTHKKIAVNYVLLEK